MSERARWITVCGCVTLLAAAVLVTILTEHDGGPSALSARWDGWAGARLYLEATGRHVEVSGRPPGRGGPAAGVLVLAFPASRPLWPDDVADLLSQVRGGRSLVVGYSGKPPAVAESLVLRSLQLEPGRICEEAPNDLRGWLAFYRRTERLTGPGTWPTVEVGRIEWAPKAPGSAEIWYQDGSGAPLVFAVHAGRGKIVALPAELWSNARLQAAGNADLLEQLVRQLGPDWTFDEWSHGLVEQPTDDLAAGRHAFDLLLLHLGMVAVLGMWTLSRRFGTPWRRSTECEASVAGFLRDLGALHARLGHHREAALALVARAREHDQRLVRLPRRPEVNGGHELMALARAVARHQAGEDGFLPPQGDQV